jgi:cyclopropane fatty-acyl-phospholipid synthase-like methyltransferase
VAESTAHVVSRSHDDTLVFPVSVEAHSLPFAAGFFDAIVSVDSFHYYGTDIRYLA